MGRSEWLMQRSTIKHLIFAAESVDPAAQFNLKCWSAPRVPHKRRSEVCRGGTVLTSFDVRPVAWRSQNWERAKREGQTMMMDDPVELDEHRGMAALKSTEICRRLHEVQAD